MGHGKRSSARFGGAHHSEKRHIGGVGINQQASGVGEPEVRAAFLALKAAKMQL
jgi:hypothetical protein